MKITVSSQIEETPRVALVRGIFDMQPETHSTMSWDVSLDLEFPWNVGLIVGPSGCGKSTIAKHLWPENIFQDHESLWPKDQSILDAFPEPLETKEVAQLLSSVGFSSPPSWLRPYRVLSTGQKFRASLALALARHREGPLVFDEFTSVVDRTVAKIGSAAAAKLIRRREQQFIAISCHEDVAEWLQPDWVYEPATNTLTRRSLRQRPKITLEIIRCKRSAWKLFAQHHYLDEDIAKYARYFLVTWEDKPVCFTSWIHNFGTQKTRREHRTVTLPDYQGVGIGNAVSDFMASVYSAAGYRATSTTTHPAMIDSRKRSPNWVVHRRPRFANKPKFYYENKQLHDPHSARGRLTVGFTCVGPKAPKESVKLLEGE